MYDEEDDEVMDNNNQNPAQANPAAGNGSRNKNGDRRNGSRLSDQVDMDDEPALIGYERYEKWFALPLEILLYFLHVLDLNVSCYANLNI